MDRFKFSVRIIFVLCLVLRQSRQKSFAYELFGTFLRTQLCRLRVCVHTYTRIYLYESFCVRSLQALLDRSSKQLQTWRGNSLALWPSPGSLSTLASKLFAPSLRLFARVVRRSVRCDVKKRNRFHQTSAF